MSDDPDAGARAAPSPAPRAAYVPVPRTARLWSLGDATTARETWVVLHGYGQLAERFVGHFAPLAHGRLFVAPEGLSRFYVDASRGGGTPPRVGASWMTREDRLHEIDDYLGWLDRALETAGGAALLERAPLHVLGFSQGTATACRWLEHRARLGAPPAARLVLWAGGVPPELDPARAASLFLATPLTLVAAADDPLVSPEAMSQEEERLLAARVPHAVEHYSGGHRLVPEVLRRVIGG